MKVTLLGTGTSQGVPVIACGCAVCSSPDPNDKRLRSSILIEAEGVTVVIDTGPDFRQQMLRANVKHLDAVIFTHQHKDHIAGLDDVRAYNFKQNRAMDVYADVLTTAQLKQEFAYVFSEHHYPGIPQLALHLLTAEPITIPNPTQPAESLVLQPIPIMHYQLPIYGFRIHNFAYITDASLIPELSKALLHGLDVLVLNALRHEKHIAHFNLAEAVAIAQELKPKQTYFTHISHLLGRHEDVNAQLPLGIALGYDGQVFYL